MSRENYYAIVGKLSEKRFLMRIEAFSPIVLYAVNVI